jgi:hypothetical protein
MSHRWEQIMAESNLPLEKALEMFREQDRTAAERRRASSRAAAANERRRQEDERLAGEGVALEPARRKRKGE